MRFFILLLFQGLILKAVSLQLGYFNVFIYPLFILLLPINFSITSSLLWAFAMGIGVDLFYGTPGLHAATILVTAYIRPFFIKAFELKEITTNRRGIFVVGLEFTQFLRLAIWLTLIHHVVFHFLEAFGFERWDQTLIKIFAGTTGSLILMTMYVLIMRPKNI
jgi:hypothetical protein